MPKPSRKGRDRIDYKAEPAFIDAVKQGAKRVGLSLSGYLTVALRRQLKEDGIEPPPMDKPSPAEPPPPTQDPPKRARRRKDGA